MTSFYLFNVVFKLLTATGGILGAVAALTAESAELAGAFCSFVRLYDVWHVAYATVMGLLNCLLNMLIQCSCASSVIGSFSKYP